MGNMFNTPFEIHRRYDLKGSWVGRVTKEEDKDPSVALKDVDFTKANESILVGAERKAKLVAQIEKDSIFLRDNNIIDYSLLLGVYLLGGPSQSTEEKGENPESCMGLRGASATPQMATGATVRMTSSDDLHGEVPFHQAHMGGMLSSDQKVLYFLGIIDILTPYDSRKHLEHWFKDCLSRIHACRWFRKQSCNTTWMSGTALRPQRGFVLPSCYVRGAVQFFPEELYTLRGILLHIILLIPSLKMIDCTC
ncbi:unnamed protein product [Symbiodinium necroappetens]|uniref:PIPK domain-containing protein n=1 Tax=Symbiodinium necroappetens TaxID=1628268 RepID=A0A812QAH2_9DINO|nr:unnamed protein product [Symbiodinium necroappetens]